MCKNRFVPEQRRVDPSAKPYTPRNILPHNKSYIQHKSNRTPKRTSSKIRLSGAYDIWFEQIFSALHTDCLTFTFLGPVETGRDHHGIWIRLYVYGHGCIRQQVFCEWSFCHVYNMGNIKGRFVPYIITGVLLC